MAHPGPTRRPSVPGRDVRRRGRLLPRPRAAGGGALPGRRLQGRGGSPEAAFDRGNALVLLGKYDDAVTSYDRALGLRPGWAGAAENRTIAVVRRDRPKTEGGDATGGQTKPDAVVFGKTTDRPAADETEVAGGDPLSDE